MLFLFLILWKSVVQIVSHHEKKIQLQSEAARSMATMCQIALE